MSIVGYAPVTTGHQSLGQQRDALVAASCENDKPIWLGQSETMLRGTEKAAVANTTASSPWVTRPVTSKDSGGVRASPKLAKKPGSSAAVDRLPAHGTLGEPLTRNGPTNWLESTGSG